jgi:tRNA-binding protein
MSGEYSAEDFWRFDIRVGAVLAAERVQGSQKLIKMVVDLGSESRTIVTGIADEHDPTELVGKKMLFVANLIPKKIFGIESRGMLLLAEDGKKRTYLVVVDDVVPVGAKFY